MALPRTLPSEFAFPIYPSNVGPFYANGAVYIVGIETITQTYLQVWKSSDPDTTAFTMQDADQVTLRSAGNSLGGSLSVWLDGNILHCATSSSDTTSDWDDAVAYWRFDTSTDTWSDGHGAWGTVLSAFGGDGDPSVGACDIRVHTVSTEEWIEIAYNGGQGKVHGTTYERVMLATYDPGAGWTTDQVWDYSATTDQASYYEAGLALSNDRVHGMVTNGGTTTYVSTITASGTINAANTSVTTTQTMFRGKGGITYNDGTDRVRSSISNAGADSDDLIIIEYDSADSSITLTENVVLDGTTNVKVPSYLLDGIAVDGEDVYLFWATFSNGYLAYDLNDGTDVTENNGISLSNLTGDSLSIGRHSYTVGGRNVIGYIYDDNGTKEYNEFSLAAPPDDFPVVPHEALQLTAVPIHTF
jgi:hypothetical protein